VSFSENMTACGDARIGIGWGIAVAIALLAFGVFLTWFRWDVKSKASLGPKPL